MLFAAVGVGVVVLEDVFVARQRRCLRYLHHQLLPISAVVVVDVAVAVAVAELGSPVEQQLLQDDRREQPVSPTEAIPLLLP